MVMSWLTWVLVGFGALVVCLALLGPRVLPGPVRRRLRGGGRPRRVANSALLLTGPLVRARVRWRRLLYLGLGVVSVVGLVAASSLAGRPVERATRNEALASRDIVLCLDVSVSMVSVDIDILRTFSELLDTFEGERVALVVWNTTAQTMVPLTDDYDLLRQQFARVTTALKDRPTVRNYDDNDYDRTFSGTQLPDVDSSSLIGDGLASCSLAFDNQLADRSRSIILASDNQVFDRDHLQIYSLPEAADLATEENIRLFSLFGADPDTVEPELTGTTLDQARTQLRTVTEEHQGKFYEVDENDTASRIVKELEADQATELASESEVRVTDTPQAAGRWLLAAVAALLVVAAWRRA